MSLRHPQQCTSAQDHDQVEQPGKQHATRQAQGQRTRKCSGRMLLQIGQPQGIQPLLHITGRLLQAQAIRRIQITSDNIEQRLAIDRQPVARSGPLSVWRRFNRVAGIRHLQDLQAGLHPGHTLLGSQLPLLGHE